MLVAPFCLLPAAQVQCSRFKLLHFIRVCLKIGSPVHLLNNSFEKYGKHCPAGRLTWPPIIVCTICRTGNIQLGIVSASPKHYICGLENSLFVASTPESGSRWEFAIYVNLNNWIKIQCDCLFRMNFYGTSAAMGRSRPGCSTPGTRIGDNTQSFLVRL